MPEAMVRACLVAGLLLGGCDGATVEDAGVGDAGDADSGVGVIPAQWASIYFGEEDGFDEPMPVYMELESGPAAVTICSLSSSDSVDPLRGDNCDRDPEFEVDGDRLQVRYELPWPGGGGSMAYELSGERQADGSFVGSWRIPSGILITNFAMRPLTTAEYDAMFE